MSDQATDNSVNITVDGVPMKARKGEMLIRITDANDVYVPRFCYHDKLPIAANCRMCLVEIEKAPKPMPACATPVAEGMIVHTRSAKAIAAQKATMEFLLINHPLDCPICDQGGECELQDLAMGFGRDISRFHERKRVVKDKNLGPLVSTDMTRCIHCTRCVRFGQDIAGIPELGTTGRGEHMEIGTFIEKSVDHELSGNIIDLCPVGALNSKPFRFRARSWEMTQQALVSPHDGLGSNLFGHVLRGKLMRVVPRQNDLINETWISDRDRFSYEGVYSGDRLTKPMVRDRNRQWRETDWQTALAAASDGLQAVQADRLGFLASPSSTVEELHLLERIARGLSCANLDHRLRQVDFTGDAADPLQPGLGLTVAAVDDLQALLIIGSNLRREIPLLANRVRKAAMRGAKVSFVNPSHFDYLFPVASYIVASPAEQLRELTALVAAAIEGNGAFDALRAELGTVDIQQSHRDVVATLAAAERKAIWLGALALRHPAYSRLRSLAEELARVTGATIGVLAEGANAAGAHLAGVLPRRGAAGATAGNEGLDAGEMLAASLDAYFLLGVEPWADSLHAGASAALRGAKFVVAATPYASAEMKELAHVLLPIGSFAETSGTYVNLEGEWQSFTGVAQPVGDCRPGWKVLRVLGNQLGLGGFEQQTSEDVREQLRSQVEAAKAPEASARATFDRSGSSTDIVVDVPGYQIDGLVRRAPSLQKTREGKASRVVYGSSREAP